MKKAFLVLACVLLLTGCGKVKLDDGKNAIVTFDEGGISAQELYDSLKETYGGQYVMNLIDSYLLNKLYDTNADEIKYVNQTIKEAKKSAKELSADFDAYLNYYYGVSNEKAFKEYLTLNYKRDLWVKDYAKESVSDKQVNEYYEDEVVGDMDASHILITVNSKDDDSEEDKQAAEDKALKTAEKIIKELKNGKDFAELAKKYSEDSETASSGGSLGKINTGDYVDEVIEALKDMKVGSYSTTPVKSSYGYHILYLNAQDEKAQLDEDLTDEIKTTIGNEIADDNSFYFKALKALREKYNMKFKDTKLEKAFNEYYQNYQNTYSISQ